MTIQELAEKITNSVLITVDSDGTTIAKTDAQYWESLSPDILSMEIEEITFEKMRGGKPAITIYVTANEDTDTEPGEEEPEPDDDDNNDNTDDESGTGSDDGTEPDDSNP